MKFILASFNGKKLLCLKELFVFNNKNYCSQTKNNIKSIDIVNITTIFTSLTVKNLNMDSNFFLIKNIIAHLGNK